MDDAGIEGGLAFKTAQSDKDFHALLSDLD
jgi:hypothetical protein